MPAGLFSAPDGLTAAAPDDRSMPQYIPGFTSWRVSGGALKPRENDVSYGVSASGGCAYVTAGDTFTVWNIEPNLPPGTRVDTLRMYYYDTSASSSSAWFTIYDLYGAIVQEWSVSTEGSSGHSFNDSAQINHTVDYSQYSYLLNWRPNVAGSAMQLCGFRVFHEFPQPPPAPLLVPGAPQSLTPGVSGGTVTLAWMPPGTGGSPASYVVEAGSAPGLSNLASVPVIGTSFVASGVPRGTYYVRVRAVNAAGSGPPTADVTVVVP